MKTFPIISTNEYCSFRTVQPCGSRQPLCEHPMNSKKEMRRGRLVSIPGMCRETRCPLHPNKKVIICKK